MQIKAGKAKEIHNGKVSKAQQTPLEKQKSNSNTLSMLKLAQASKKITEIN